MDKLDRQSEGVEQLGESESSAEESRVIFLTRSATQRRAGTVQKSDIVDIWRMTSADVDHAFRTMDDLGIDSTPIRKRLNVATDLDVIQILTHMREYIVAIFKVYELKIEKEISILAVHPQKSLSDAAMKYAESPNFLPNRNKLIELYEWLKIKELGVSDIMEYIDNCR